MAPPAGSPAPPPPGSFTHSMFFSASRAAGEPFGEAAEEPAEDITEIEAMRESLMQEYYDPDKFLIFWNSDVRNGILDSNVTRAFTFREVPLLVDDSMRFNV